MFNILLIRAASTEYTSQGRVQGTLDVPLSEDGRRQAELAAEQLCKHPVDMLLCGPCRASQQTAKVIGQRLGIKPKTNDLLRNLDLGLWQGMLIEDVKTKQPKVYRQWQERPETVCPPEGETLQHAQERLLSVQSKLIKKSKADTVAAVLIDPLAIVWRSLMLDEPIGDLWQMGAHRQALWESISLTAKPAGKE